jgi:tetratricopeptide (TPR) repeat protein
MKSFRFAFCIFLAVSLCHSATIWAQEVNSEDQSAGVLEEGALVAPETKLEPVFPEGNKALIFVEGEDAVSTNFTNEPILNYSCSKFRTLQLNRRTGLQGGRSFYATFVFYIEDPGEYELWYGGTPPGPADELLPSYASAFSLSLDGGEGRSVSRESVAVVEQYAPSYYWNYVGDIPLEEGQHTATFQVSYTRGYDGKFYFYLDCFFLVKKQAAGDLARELLPPVFPEDMTDRSIDTPFFKPLEEYQIVIRDNPDDLSGYLEIAQVYSLVGDYLNALKFLKRAALLDPENIEIQLLTAKNHIWKGDVSEGLETYRSLLLLDPSRLDLWLEAAKVAAWTGRYEESISLYKNALEQHPDNIDLIANLGLAYQWAGQRQNADEQFLRALNLASQNYQNVVGLAESYNINGVPERSITVLRNSLRRYPDRLELYLLLENIYTRLDRTERAAEVQNLISASFRPSPRLSQYLELFYSKERLREEVIAGYEAELERQPDNLELRETLAQTYFWNGKRKKAIGELQNVLANHAFIEINQLDQNSTRLLELLDRSCLYLEFCNRIPGLIKDRKSEIDAAISRYDDAEKACKKFQIQVQEARDRDEPPPVPDGEDPQDTLKEAERALAQTLDNAESLADKIEEMAELGEQDWSTLDPLVEEEARAAETFDKIIKPIRWEWDRRSFVEELAAMDSVLADYVIGKILLAEGQLDGAERRLSSRAEAENLPRQYQTALFRTLLWQTEVSGAFKVLETGQFDAFTLLPYWQELNELRTAAEVEQSDSVGEIVGPDSGAAAALEALDGAERLAEKTVQELLEHRETLMSLYRSRLVRSMYRLGENTYLIRNELGDFYLRERNFPAAIRQYKQVLAIDPWDIETIYDLGTIYEWSGDWKRAMSNYQRVYWSDPLYENVSARYNQLARQRADSFELQSYLLAESSQYTVRTELSYSSWLSTLVGLRIDFALDALRPDPSSIDTYYISDLIFGVPLNFHAAKLTLTPLLGVYVGDLDVFYPLGDTPAGVDLHAGLDFGWAAGQYLYLNGGGAWGWKGETSLPNQADYHSLWGELNISTNFAFIKAYPFRYSSMRLYGKGEWVYDDDNGDNLIWSGAADLNLGVVRVEKPYVEVNLLGNFLYQDSIKASADTGDYYAPQEELLVTGGVAASTWIAVGEASSLSLGLRAVAGRAWEEGEEDPRLEIEGNLGLSKGDSSYYLRSAYNASLAEPFSFTSGGEYWSFYLGLGFSSRLPQLLAP